MSLIIGIDPSLTGTGIVALNGNEVLREITTKNKPELNIYKRVFLIREAIDDLIEMILFQEQTPDLIVIEGFSYGSKGRGVFDIAYLGHRIREDLEAFRKDDSIPWIEIPPSQLKKFATGKGNANKEIILQQVYKRWGYETSDNNIADAYVLAQIGEAYLQKEYKPEDYSLFQLEVLANLKGEKLKKVKQ